MLAHSIKHILELVPEAMPFVKQASVAEDYPLDSVDSCIASALTLKYHEHVDHASIDPYQLDKVASAVNLYGVKDKVDELASAMIKQANELKVTQSRDFIEEYLTKEAGFVGELTGFVDFERVSSEAESLLKEAREIGAPVCDEVRIYSADGVLNKRAAIEGLAARYQATENVNFVKLASAIGRIDEFTMRPETLKDICSTVAQMDKEAGLSVKGFNFYRDAVMLKSAATAMQIVVAGKQYPYDSLVKLCPDQIGHYLGKDVSDEIEAGPSNAKSVVETLPLDMQKILASLLKNS